MKDLTRREFLQVSGIAFAAHTLTTSGFDHLFSPSERIVGRALRSTAIYDAVDGYKTRPVLPDTILKIRAADDRWYTTKDGFVPRRDIQPMQIQPATHPNTLPALIEVSAPIAVVYAHTDVKATATARIGHGGVLYAIDWLPENSGVSGWYHVADAEGTPLGWTQAARWRAADLIAQTPLIDKITIDRQQNVLSASSDGREMALIAVSGAADQHAGRYEVIDRTPSACCTHDTSVFYGSPWAIALSSHLQITGAYWHNDFGTNTRSSAQIELAPSAAHWLYEHMDARATVEIV